MQVRLVARFDEGKCALRTGQMLAALLGWPQATFASKVEADPAASTATVTREVFTRNMPAPLSAALTVPMPCS